MTLPAISPDEASAMRLPRVRFTIWRMMVAVAVLAVLLASVVWAARMAWLSKSYRGHAFSLGLIEADTTRSLTLTMGKRGKAKLRRYQEYFRSLRLKYEHAARYPWLPVEPDRSEPE
jgi:hypothetical protein